jgi:hypothetical protein
MRMRMPGSAAWVPHQYTASVSIARTHKADHHGRQHPCPHAGLLHQVERVHRGRAAARAARSQQAIQNVPAPGAEQDTMGDYYPSGEYLAGPSEFKAKGCRRR